MDIHNKINEVDYLLTIIITIIIITALLLPIKVVILDDVIDFLKGDKVTDLLLAFFASISLCYTYIQFKEYRKREQAEVLGQYNERYSRDEHINNVVDYIIRFMNNEYIIHTPTTHDAEMFMRFFEEMQIQIESNRLKREPVFELFAYYAMVFDSNERIRINLGIKDYDTDDWLWSKFKVFVSDMMIHHLKDIRWKPKCDNANIKSLIFDRAGDDNKSPQSNLIIIREFSYGKGIITAQEKKYAYVFSGTTVSDELHCIDSNQKYEGQRIDKE